MKVYSNATIFKVVKKDMKSLVEPLKEYPEILVPPNSDEILL